MISWRLKNFGSYFPNGLALTIRSKLVLVISILIAVIALFISLFFPSRQEKQALAAITDKARSIANMTAYSISPALYFDDSLAINEVIESALLNRDLAYLLVVNDSGRIVDAYNKDLGLLTSFPGANPDESFSVDSNLYRVTTTIAFNKHSIGELYLGFSLQDLRAELIESRSNIALVSLLIFIFGIVAAIGISAVITKPLTRMVETAKQITQGDFTLRADISAKDEVGDLAKAFNVMVDNMVAIQSKLVDLNANLEENVRERTQELREEIGERKRTEEELARSVSLLTTTLESTADGILVVDNEGKIVNFNQKFVDMWSIPQDIIQSRDGDKAINYVLDQLRHPEIFINKVKELYAASDMVSFDVLEFTDGRIFERYSHPQHSGDQCAGRVWSFRDVTERKHLEESLRQSQKMEAVGKLAGGVAHDFNNILTIILGYSEFLSSKISSENPMYRHVLEIKKAGERAASLTGQLLAFSRKQILAPQVLDLNAVVANMEKMLRRLIGEDIDMVFLPKKDLGRIRADKSQIEQIILNLIVNARDAMPKGGKITLETANVDLDESYARTHSEASPGPYVLLTVSDTGVGMDAETQARIFEPFFTTKEVGKGTGLGLSTVYGIVKQSGGNIWVYSELGKGTTFKIYIPRAENVDEAEGIKRISPESLIGNETILLVEDEESVKDLAFSILVQKGYTVLETNNGEEALQVSEKYTEKIHLMLTDVVMPILSGQQLAEKMAVIRPDTKVLFMSGYTDEAVVRHGVLSPTTAFIQKPFTPDTLAQKVREVLDSPSYSQKPAVSNEISSDS
jgi:signal transduction histidine kinase/HAMP domain-containing protein/ActR/RegA family two-component response regulator